MEASELFTELLFGSGSWIGLLLILSIIFVVSFIDKRSSIIFIPLSIFMGFMYLENVSANSYFMWSAILMFITTIFLVIRVVELSKKR